ncbi:glycosyltransferase family 2 protein [Paenibacillus farraposensis]|uniref:Glycosyltransferase family 2 protein n=1 Tax=Paenibacillus farraposensis TaxID=2807095 RepID=A0ABW4DII2_9BACL|nr:glycosyltransferase family A protein [Paenibacillus farraposensis]MCC3378202.1 glycosyltransferase family 2 protein [Paenibacillus farraposensis]
MIQASVIMPTYNKAEYLELTLASFSGQQHNNFEIIIIDDGSTDHTAKVVQKYKNKLIFNIYSSKTKADPGQEM